MKNERKRFYKRPIFYIPAIVVAIPGLWLAWWLGSPLFLDKTVVESFPVVTTAAPQTPPAPSAPPADTTPPAPDEPTAAPVDDPVAAATTVAPSVSAAPAPPTTVSSEPAALLSGMFKDADSRHKGSGDATIYQLADGTRVLRVENLDVTNGPDLHVYLTPVADASDSDDTTAEGYLDLGELKGNKGDQNYIILGDLDLEKEWTVVIYCVPFHVVFSTAPLAAPVG